MPTVLRAEGYRFFFFSNEGLEPPHVHVQRGDGLAKLWVQPVRLAHAQDLSPAQLRRVRELTVEHQTLFLTRWNEYFDR